LDELDEPFDGLAGGCPGAWPFMPGQLPLVGVVVPGLACAEPEPEPDELELDPEFDVVD
jgi:hypothetical protein